MLLWIESIFYRFLGADAEKDIKMRDFPLVKAA